MERDAELAEYETRKEEEKLINRKLDRFANMLKKRRI